MDHATIDRLSIADARGDVLEAADHGTNAVVRASESVSLDRANAVALRDWLTAFLGDGGPFTGALPDANADGYSWPTFQRGDTPRSTIASEAESLLYGDRENEYGTPRESFTRIAQMWTLLLQDRLAEGEYVTPEDVGRCMLGLKLARDVNHPKRDGRVDMAGYAIALDRLETGK